MNQWRGVILISVPGEFELISQLEVMCNQQNWIDFKLFKLL